MSTSEELDPTLIRTLECRVRNGEPIYVVDELTAEQAAEHFAMVKRLGEITGQPVTVRYASPLNQF